MVDDGSTDGTSAIADQIAAADPRIRVVRTPRNHGKGYAVRVGVQAAQGELVVFTDADGSYGPDQLERGGGGARPGPGGRGPPRRPARAGLLLRRLASPVFNRVMRLLLGLPFSDTQCGLKGFRRVLLPAVFRRARVDGFAFRRRGALLVARRLGLEVVEVPVTAQERQGSWSACRTRSGWWPTSGRSAAAPAASTRRRGSATSPAEPGLSELRHRPLGHRAGGGPLRRHEPLVGGEPEHHAEGQPGHLGDVEPQRPGLAQPRSTTRMQALAISSPTPFSRKNTVYSRRRLVRARCRKVQCRFMKNEEVAATAIEAVLAPMADQSAQVQQVGQTEVKDGVDGADDAELGHPWARCRQRR